MRNVNIYKFEKNTEYMLNIHCQRCPGTLKYVKFYFFPLKKTNLKRINADTGFIHTKVPMIGIIDSNQKKNFTINSNEDSLEILGCFYGMTNEKIENDLEILTNLTYVECENKVEIKKEDSINTILLLIPQATQIEMKAYMIDEVETECKDSYFIPAKTSKMIYCEKRKRKWN